jgi:hypothetical protein
MEKEKLTPWIEKLNAEPDGKKRNAIVAEICKENGIKIGEAYKALKDAGYDPKAAPPAAPTPPVSKDGNGTDTPPPNIDDDDKDTPPPKLETETEKKITVTLRHKTEYPRYRRAGLVLSQKAQSYDVTEAQLAALKKDKWVVIEGAAK